MRLCLALLLIVAMSTIDRTDASDGNRILTSNEGHFVDSKSEERRILAEAVVLTPIEEKVTNNDFFQKIANKWKGYRRNKYDATVQGEKEAEGPTSTELKVLTRQSLRTNHEDTTEVDQAHTSEKATTSTEVVSEGNTGEVKVTSLEKKPDVLKDDETAKEVNKNHHEVVQASNVIINALHVAEKPETSQKFTKEEFVGKLESNHWNLHDVENAAPANAKVEEVAEELSKLKKNEEKIELDTTNEEWLRQIRELEKAGMLKKEDEPVLANLVEAMGNDLSENPKKSKGVGTLLWLAFGGALTALFIAGLNAMAD